MATAIDYPITLGFGAKLKPYYGTLAEDGYVGTVAPAHHGIDYGAPAWTLIVVSGTTIGFVGATGAVTGVHLHTDKNPSFPATSGYVNPTGWQNIRGVVVFSGLAGTAGNMVVVKATDGYYYRFLHMARISSGVGAIVGNMTPIDVLRIIASEVEGFDMTKTHTGVYDKILKDAWGSKPPEDYVRHAWKIQPKHRGHLINDINKLKAQVVALQKQLADTTQYEPVTETLYKKKV